jgi:flavin-dependent dehydrogenase
MKIFDIIIVGGGPAGTTAGYWLGQAGLVVLIKNFCGKTYNLQFLFTVLKDTRNSWANNPLKEKIPHVYK